MAIVRRIARPLLASIFIYGGIDALRNAEAKVPAADKLVSTLPPKLPVVGTTKQLVQADAAAKILGGTMLALGRLPRLSSLGLAASIIPTTLAGHRFWEEKDPAKRKMQQLQFVKNASILGGVLLAAVDTHGKPSIGWRARRAAADLRSSAGDTASALSDKASALSDKASALGEKASALGDKASTLGDKASALGEKAHDLLPIS
jgi:putative oxidoreductase